MFFKSLALLVLLVPVGVDDRVRAVEEYQAWRTEHDAFLEAIKTEEEAKAEYEQAKAARFRASTSANGAYIAWLNAENAISNSD